MSIEQRITDRIAAVYLQLQTQIDKSAQNKWHDSIESTLQRIEPKIIDVIRFAISAGVDLDHSELIRDFIFFFCTSPAWAGSEPTHKMTLTRYNILSLYSWAIQLCTNLKMPESAWWIYEVYQLENKSLLIAHLPKELQSAARITL